MDPDPYQNITDPKAVKFFLQNAGANSLPQATIEIDRELSANVHQLQLTIVC
jgi:hypothetical protein